MKIKSRLQTDFLQWEFKMFAMYPIDESLSPTHFGVNVSVFLIGVNVSVFLIGFEQQHNILRKLEPLKISDFEKMPTCDDFAFVSFMGTREKTQYSR